MKSLRNYGYNLARQSERYFKTDLVYATKGGFWLGLERTAAVLAGFLLSVAFANLLEPEKYGVYKYVLAMMGIAGAFSLAGLMTAVNRAVAQGWEGSLRAGFSLSLKWSVGTILFAFLLAAYYFTQGNSMLGISFLIGGTFMPLITSSALYDNFLAGKQQFRHKAILGALRNTVPPALLIGALYITYDPIWLIGVYFIGTAGITFFNFWETLQRYKPNDQVDTTLLSYSKHLSLMNILGVISSQIDRVLIFSLLGGTALAVYSIAEAVPDQIRSLNSIIGTLSLPKFAQRSLHEVTQALPRKAFILFLISLALTALYIVIAPYFFSIFFPKYLDSVPYSQVYALAILSVPGVLFSNALVAHMKNRELYIQKIVTSVSRISLLVLLIPLFQVWGAVFASLITYVVMGLLFWWQFRRL